MRNQEQAILLSVYTNEKIVLRCVSCTGFEKRVYSQALQCSHFVLFLFVWNVLQKCV